MSSVTIRACAARRCVGSVLSLSVPVAEWIGGAARREFAGINPGPDYVQLTDAEIAADDAERAADEAKRFCAAG